MKPDPLHRVLYIFMICCILLIPIFQNQILCSFEAAGYRFQLFAWLSYKAKDQAYRLEKAIKGV